MIPLNDLNYVSKKLPISSIDCIIKLNNNFLLIKRNRWPAKNKYTFPGSVVQKNISIKKSIKNLVKRELNINFLSKPKLVGVKKFIFFKDFYGKKNKIEYMSHLYLIKLTKKEIKNIAVDNNHLNFVFFDKNEIIKNKNVIGQIKNFIKNNF
jgi:ADP-ribose pyrophosphatase YjhB (NUDIX family)